MLSSLLGYSQQKMDSKLGTIQGLIRDSLLNYGLPSATIAIYKINDSALVAYQLSDNLGAFKFNTVPVGVKLKIVATYIGYSSLSRTVLLDSNSKILQMKPFNLYKNENVLSEIEIKAVAPVRMNRDTLEFNADAFKLEPNAVAEDLLRKLPGVVVWGDGSITVNGKEIKSLLVNGKPFFGGDNKVSTQNIPKNALDKVQVYRTDVDPNNPLDTLTEVNLKLKKEMSLGYFGKIGLGIGTDKRYEADASMNFFDRQNQIGLVGASNNINKTAGNASSLLKNNTFKGVGASIDYQPNFKADGITHSKSGGFLFQHDFTADLDNRYKNRLWMDYFINDQNNVSNNQSIIKSSLGENVDQLITSTGQNTLQTLDQNLKTKYENKIGNYNFNIRGSISQKRRGFANQQLDTISNNSLGLQSTRNLIKNEQADDKKYAVGTTIQHLKSKDASSNYPGDWLLDYILEGGINNQVQKNNTDFKSITDATKNSYFNRLNNTDATYTNHNMNIKFGDFSGWLFGRSASLLNNISVEFQNNLKISRRKDNNNIYDIIQGTGAEIYNSQLSSDQVTNELDERPNVRLNKGFNRLLANRYHKKIFLDFNIQGQLYRLENLSTQSFQNVSRNYQKFIPNATFSYSNLQYGESQKSIIFSYLSSYNFPTPDQLNPIPDYSNIYNVRLPNRNLLPSHRHQFSLNYGFLSQRSKQTFSYNLGPTLTIINANHSLYTSTDTDGRSTYSFVNLDGYRSLGLSGELIKAFKKQDNLLQVKLTTTLSVDKVPLLTKNFEQTEPISSFNENTNILNNLLLYYSFKDVLAININQNWNRFSSKLLNDGGEKFISINQVTSFAASVKVTQKLALASNLDYNHTSFTGISSNNFSIWNANATYRFLNGNNLEAKFSAMDLLRQNRSVQTMIIGNTIKQSRVNVLQQYFMLTISYFPRKFGKNKSSF